MSSNHAAISMFRQHVRHVGADLPAATLKAISTADALRKISVDDVVGEGPALADAVAAAVRAGTEPLASPDVQRALHAEHMAQVNITARLGDLGNREIIAALTEHADAIIETWRPVAEQAGEALAAFRAIAPGADITDATIASRLPARALTPWGAARDATARLEQVAAAWTQLAEITSHAYIHHGNRPLILADLDFDQLDQLGHNPKPGTVAQLDVSIELATAAEFAERAARINAARAEHGAERAAAPARAQEAAARQFYGAGQSITVPSPS